MISLLRIPAAYFLAILFVSLSAFTSLGAQSRDWAQYPDYTELRTAIGWSDDYWSRCFTKRPLAAMTSYLNQAGWQEAVKIGSEWLESCPIDIRVHYYMSIALKKLGEESIGDIHLSWARGLMNSISSSGDGETPESAYVVISIAEEYDALYMFGLTFVDQSLVQGKSTLDLMRANNKEGREFSIYFNPSAHFSRITNMPPNKAAPN